MFQFKSSCTVIYLLVVTKHVPEFQQNKGQNNCSLSHFLRFRKAEVMNNKKKILSDCILFYFDHYKTSDFSGYWVTL
jgi:hypothetical protein